MRALVIKTSGEKSIVEFTQADEYEVLRNAVGGYIESVGLRNCIMWVNEEGKLLDLPVNYDATEMYINAFGPGLDIIVGDVIITGPADAEGYCTGIPDCFAL